uniref:Pentatricopeptide repeat-containing protein n=1 Tax=Macrostomum lignano TaxID=282301 RepID=A0A1I8JRJ2_9PLAT
MNHPGPAGRVKRRSWTGAGLPLNGKACVDMLITREGRVHRGPGAGLVLTEIAEGISVQDLVECTEAQSSGVPSSWTMMGQI